MATPTLIACLTPPGAGAIATLAVRGPLAWPITRSLFRTRLPEAPIPGTFYLGRLGEEPGACDEVVLAVNQAWLELHCHGGAEIVRFLGDLYAARGVVHASWTEVTLVGASRLRTLALEQFVQAPTIKTASILLDQVHGAFERTAAEIRKCFDSGAPAAAQRLLARLVQTQHLGRHLVQPFRVVLAGPPNVGKSSLVNALAGYTRSLVSTIPGTTRDVVSTRIALDGWPVELIDTAGLHATGDGLERAGMTRARQALEQADLRVWVFDASAPRLDPPADIPFQGFVVNKVDLPAAWECRGDAHVSARTGRGLTEFCQWLARALHLDEALCAGEGVAFTPHLCDQVLQAPKGLECGLETSLG